MTLEYPADANARRERAFERIRDNGSARLVALTTSRPPNGNRSVNPKDGQATGRFRIHADADANPRGVTNGNR